MLLANLTRNRNFSKWLTEALTQFGLTPKVLSARSGRAKSTISMLMSGERKPSRTMATGIARAVAKDADPHIADHIIHQALQAAGYSSPSLAAAFIREKLAQEDIPESALTADQMDDLITEIEAITVFRIQRALDEAQKERGKKRRRTDQEGQTEQEDQTEDERFPDEDKLVSRAGRN